MDVTALLSEIDREIARLEQARTALSRLDAPVKRGSGWPAKKSTPTSPKKHTLSPEARARIAAAQKKRWAAAKKGK